MKHPIDLNKIVLADQDIVDTMEDAVHLLVSLIEPSLTKGSYLVTDESTLLDFDSCSTIEQMENKIFDYLGDEVVLDITKPIWLVVDQIKMFYPNFPEKETIQ